MALFKKVGVRCDGGACKAVTESEIDAVPLDALDTWLTTIGFVKVDVKVQGASEEKFLCNACAAKLNGIFK